MVQVLCIACNVGALLKHVEVISADARDALIGELGDVISRCDAPFVAIHFQECVTPLEVIVPLLEHPSTRAYSQRHVLLDALEKTGLCSLYMYDPNLVDATLLKVGDDEGSEVTATEVEGMQAIAPSHCLVLPIPKEVLPFPGTFHQKGVMHVCWRLDGSEWGLMNLHLPHETDNTESLQRFPSVVAQNRAAALLYLLDQCVAVTPTQRLIICGDFNFRPGLRGVFQTLFQVPLPGCGPAAAPTPDEPSAAMEEQAQKIAFEWELAEAHAAVARHGGLLEKRKFSAGTLTQRFASPAPANPLWIHDEGHLLPSSLYEAPVTFPPTYGWAGVAKGGETLWTKKRCPAWTDRVLMTPAAREGLTLRAYDAVGIANAAIVDHKPVYLHANLQ
jgi:hypothetical protein